MDSLLNALIISFAIIISNIGARYIHLDLNSERQRFILEHPYTRYLYIYCMSFIGVRDFQLSAVVTVIYFLIINILR